MTLHGYDISHWQAGLDLDEVDAAFVIMKATDGTSFVDQTCDAFYTKAKKLGMLRGVYHFAQTGSDAEADHFIANTRGYHGDAVLALDWESDAVAHGPAAAKRWLDRVHDRTGVRPLIYMSQSVATSYDWSAVAKHYGLWVARYNDTIGPTGAWSDVAMWQYTRSARDGGFTLDADRFYGDKAAWHAYAAGTTTSGDDDKPAPAPTVPQIAVDGIWGTGTTKRIQQVLDAPYKDGKISRQDPRWRGPNPGLTSGWVWDAKAGDGGSQTIKKIQGKVGVTKDGRIGPDTIKAMQRHYDTPVDGVVSHPSPMVRAMQKRLNTGKF